MIQRVHCALHVRLVVQEYALQRGRADSLDRCRTCSWVLLGQETHVRQFVAEDLLERLAFLCVLLVLLLLLLLLFCGCDPCRAHRVDAVEPVPEQFDLVSRRIAQTDGQINSARANERVVESINVVRGQEDDAFLGAGDAVQRVQQPRERDVRARVALGVGRAAVRERDVHVFQEHERAGWDDGQEVIELVICETALRQVQDSDIVVQIACQSLDEG